jgi:hypothetical protein
MRTKRVIIGLIVALIMAGAPMFAQSTRTSSENAFVNAIIESGDAIGAHDIAKFISYFSPDFAQDSVVGSAMVPRAALEKQLTGMVTADPKLFNFVDRIFVNGNVAFADGCSFSMTNPSTGKPFRVFHSDIYTFANGKISTMSTFGEGALGGVVLGKMEPTLPVPAAPGVAPWPKMPVATRLAPLAAQREAEFRLSSHNLDSLAAMLRTNAQIMISPMFDMVGRDSFIHWMDGFLAAFPDLTVSQTRSFEFPDGWVVSEVKLAGTQKGSWMGHPASYKPFALRAAWLSHYDADGLSDTMKFYFSGLTLLTQLGYKPVAKVASH